MFAGEDLRKQMKPRSEIDRIHREFLAKGVVVYDSEESAEMLARGEVTHISEVREVGTLVAPGLISQDLLAR